MNVNTFRYFSFPAGSGQPSSAGSSWPVCGITLLASGPMKAGRNDDNRTLVFRRMGIDPESVMSVTQIHSRVVHVADSAPGFSGRPEGDGIITVNRALVPSVSVADCMPIYLFDPVTGCFGVLHSGWKGTGIIRTAFELAADEWGAKPDDFRVVLGPHIRSCCYTVDAERADYFSRAFGPSCVVLDEERAAAGSKWPWRLSLAEANRLLCASLGVPSDQVLDTGDCTACAPEFGSSRREGGDHFTHMSAFILFR